ncbi:cation diffusion facilitator family transporter [Paraburkholderia unamae]|uniref:Cation diffusion facilitator family transporter n=1 Tax=Paraburkholderia unamae TaxID=219649 RepID=A0ABX5K9Z9_9BURK|nr:cation diffusion facilitator family transporter [Paraburkholderia unamae]PVX61378.1 cation diffusion facilitator family transporter [Paraburkholderia unamae]RAR49306.1 cation diffusion facilitator family transporter [Paraburkholderia unamae]
MPATVPRAVYYALASNVAVAICKFAAALYTNSGATLAEAAHSSADCLNQILLIAGRRAAHNRPDEQHPLGFGRETHFYAMLVALQFFMVGGGVSVAIGVWRLWHHSGLDRPEVAVGVLLLSALVEGIALRASIHSIDRRRRAGGLWRWFRETGELENMLSIVEDAAALVGVLVSVAGTGLAALTGWAGFDALGSIGVGCVMMATAVFSLREIKSLIVGEAARASVRQEMRAWLDTRPEIRHVVSLVVLRWSDNLLVAVQAQLTECCNAEELVRTIDRVENDLHGAFPKVRWVFFEPELREHGEHPV